MSPRFTIGVSLKMYFSYAQTLEWSRAVAAICRRHPAVTGGVVDFFVTPSYPAIPAVVQIMAGLAVGAQDICAEEPGAFTGEVSGAELAELGCRLVEVGHAERRRLYCETDDVVARKTRAALRSGLVPLVCIGEDQETDAASTISACVDQAVRALAKSRAESLAGQVVFAYEPVWAIGAEGPADPTYIRAVCGGVRAELAGRDGFRGSKLIYGGSAGPGLLTQIASEVDGLFLGRFAHEPSAVETVLDEALAAADGVGAGLDVEQRPPTAARRCR